MMDVADKAAQVLLDDSEVAMFVDQAGCLSQLRPDQGWY